MYKYGKGVPKDYAEAVKWFRKAAEQGHAKAQYFLGTMYETGSKGVPQDYAEALRWYRKAAEQGHADAPYNVAALNRRNKSVPADATKAE
jgi:TPR repeat protein